MLKSFKSFKSFKGDSNLLFQIRCKSTAILLYRYEENIKKLLNILTLYCMLNKYHVYSTKLATISSPPTLPIFPLKPNSNGTIAAAIITI